MSIIDFRAQYQVTAIVHTVFTVRVVYNEMSKKVSKATLKSLV